MGEFEREGMRFNFEEMGHPENPPVILLHGFAGEARHWYPVMRGLSDDYRVIAPDLRGHGRSATPDDPGDYSIEGYADDLLAALDSLHVELAAIVGCDLGGMVALQFATGRPERVAALCVADSSPAPASDRYAPEVAEMEVDITLLEQEVRERGLADLARRRALGIRDPQLSRALRRQVTSMLPEGWLGAARARRTRPDLTPLLRSALSMPVLICTGDQAPARSAFDVMREEIDGPRAVTFKNTGHGVPFLRPDAFLRVLGEFLTDVEEGRGVAGDRIV